MTRKHRDSALWFQLAERAYRRAARRYAAHLETGASDRAWRLIQQANDLSTRISLAYSADHDGRHIAELSNY